jgi:succinate dehydrogenase/fumarate reductase-like Fe-S protein
MGEDLGTVRIYRYNPSVDTEPRFEVFEGVPFEGRTVMDVLRDLYETRDRSLAFRCSCRAGLCTACRMRVNGRSVMACMRMAEKEMLIEPPGTGEVIKDLMTTLAGAGSDEGTA